MHPPTALFFPQSYGVPLIKPRWPSKPDSLGTHFPIAGPLPRLRSLTSGSELSILWKTFCDVSSSLWATHLADIRFDLIMITSLLLSCCDSFLSLDTGYLFGSFHPFFVAVADGSLAVCCDFSVFLRSGSYHLSILPTCFILSFILL